MRFCKSDSASIPLCLAIFNVISVCYRFIFSTEQQNPAKMNWLGILTLLSLAGESRVFSAHFADADFLNFYTGQVYGLCTKLNN
jgi:hypothetical protein